MKSNYTILFLLINFIGFSQNNNLNPALPLIISASPEASSLGQYGGVPIDISSGQLNYSIQIYTIKIGDFEYPLTLNYNYSGFKPESDPTMMGIGWTANFSGAIIRQLKGTADEGVNGYFVKGDFYKNIATYSIDTKKEILKNGADGLWDTRPDKYIINAPTLSGNFRFKTNRTPIFSQPKNYIVTSDSILQYINVTDDKGILYEFNEKEKTTIWSFNATPEETEYTSSWMLKKIKLVNSNHEIAFQYQDYNINHGYKSFVKTVKNYGTYKDEGGGFKTQPSDDNTMGKVIKRIDFPNGYILFNQSISPYRTPGAYGSFISTEQVKLQSITVYNLHNEIIERFIFDYYNAGYYYFLKSIKKQGVNNALLSYYDFEYIDLDQIPSDKITNDKVDLWGFYNGETFNETNLTTSLNASFNKGKIGALNKIIYPTRGTTEITYEANNLNGSGSEPVTNPPSREPDTLTISSEDTSGCESKEKIITITDNMDFVKITLETDVSALDSWVQSSFKSTILNGISFSLTSVRGSNDYANINRYTREEYFATLYPGTYKLSTDICEAGNNPGTHYGKVTIDHHVSPTTFVGQNYGGNIGGIRIKQTQDCPNIGNDNCITKIYKYPDGGFLIDSKPRFKSFEVEVADGLESNPALTNYRRTTESYYPITPLTFLGNNIIYPTVEVMTMDESLGKTVNNFSYYLPVVPQYNYSATLPYNIPRNPSIVFQEPKLLDFPDLTEDNVKNIKLSRQTILEKPSTGFKEKQIENRIYTDQTYNDSNSVFDCIVLRYPYEVIANIGGYNDYLCPPHLQPLFHKTKDYLLTSINTIQKESNGEIASQTSFVYDSETSYPLEVKTLNSIGNEIIKKTYYPKNKSLLTGLTGSQQSALDGLVNKNIISMPIQITTVSNNSTGSTLSSTQRTNYKIWQNGSVILPEIIQTAKGTNTLNDRIQFHDYYSNGNLKEISLTNGSHTVYIWGYNKTLPIAKIENASNAQVAAALGLADINSTDENNLSAINNLRTSLPNAMVTTYTYKPLVGVSTITDPKGYTTTYTYDSFGRLEFVKDNEGNILSENQYNYKP